MYRVAVKQRFAWLLTAALLAGCSDDPQTETDPQPEPNPGEIVDRQFDIGEGLVFDARVAGPVSGDLVFLLHGFPQTSFEWRTQLSALGEAGFFTVAPNQRGYSASARPADIESYALPFLITDILNIADALGREEFHIVGHDWGAAVTWGVAIVSPSRVKTMTSVSIPHPDAFNAVLADQMSCQYSASAYFDLFVMEGFENTLLANDAAALRAFYEGLTEEAIDEYVDVLGTPEALGAALNWYRANVFDRSFGPTVGPSTVPTMLIWSDMDAAICRDGVDLTEEHVTGPYRLEVIEGASHWVPEVAADRVTELVLEQLQVSAPD